ncbi:hypothetical protein Tsubulata_028349, partial [Turnera subulata]
MSFNAHKWPFTALDCCCLRVKDPQALTKSLATNPECLRNKNTDSKKVVLDYKDWQIALSRRFRSLKLWLVMRRYGFVADDHSFEIVVLRNFPMHGLFQGFGIAKNDKRRNELNRELRSDSISQFNFQ